jgi:hypothetical protein
MITPREMGIIVILGGLMDKMLFYVQIGSRFYVKPLSDVIAFYYFAVPGGKKCLAMAYPYTQLSFKIEQEPTFAVHTSV